MKIMMNKFLINVNFVAELLILKLLLDIKEYVQLVNQ